MIVSKLAVVRVRGSVDVREGVKDTLKMMNLTRPNYCTIVDDDPSYKGMLEKVKEKVTWGPIESEVLRELLRKRGEYVDGRSVTDEEISKVSPYDTIAELADAVVEGDFELSEIEDLKVIFRLHPPKKGYEDVSRSFNHGGAMGNRGKGINDLILRML